MNKSLGTTAAVAALLAVVVAAGTGCRSTTARVTPAGTEPARTAPQIDVQEPAGPAPARAELAVSRLNVSMTTRAAGGEPAASVAQRVDKAAQGSLAERGFTLDATPADLVVKLNVSANEFDSIGNYHRYSGEVDAEARRACDARLLGREQIAERGKRQLERTPAIHALADELAARTGSWVARTCSTAASRLRADNVVITRRHEQDDDAAFARRFVARTRAMEGVLSCELIEQDYDRHEMVFRVVYFRDKFPAGLLNALAREPRLGITPVN